MEFINSLYYICTTKRNEMNFLVDFKTPKGLTDKELRDRFVNDVQRRITIIYKQKLEKKCYEDLVELYKLKNDPLRYMDHYIKYI